MSYILNYQPKMQELFSTTYKHKKFDKRKRSHDESMTISSSSQSFTTTKADDATRNNNDTPFSSIYSDNNSCSDYQCMTPTAITLNTTSPPPLKRRRLNNAECNDSGIYLTPQKLSSCDITASPARFITKLDATFPRFTSTPLRATPPPPPPLPLPPAVPVVPLTTLSPTAAILPRISNATLQNICKYHGNMVRKFPKIERTPKDQERRNKNTLACRMSRRVKKLEHIAVEEQYKEFSQQHTEIVEATMRAAAYLNELMLRLANVNGGSASDSRQKDNVVPYAEEQPKVAPNTQQPKPFSIEYLTRNESNS